MIFFHLSMYIYFICNLISCYIYCEHILLQMYENMDISMGHLIHMLP